jgi:putative transposase
MTTLLKAIPRRSFGQIVARHEGDRYVKEFGSWPHLVTLVFAQLSGVSSLRELEALWNAQGSGHYHLGAGPVRRATLSDANRRRPAEILAELFAQLTGLASRSLRREGQQMMRLIDATPIPLNGLHDWAGWNGRTRGLKAHVAYDPDADRPVDLRITPATVNDVVVGRDLPIEPKTIYVFDKAYADYRWWHRLHQNGSIFVTRPKTNVPLQVIKRRRLTAHDRQTAAILSDATVRLASQQRSRLPIDLRRIELRREDGRMLTLISNDLCRPAAEIAALYRKRWQIELLFRWIKQHLKIRNFLGRSENAVRLQIYAAMIAYLLLRIAAAASRSLLPAIRFADLVRHRIAQRISIAAIHKPPDRPTTNPLATNQLVFDYA